MAFDVRCKECGASESYHGDTEQETCGDYDAEDVDCPNCGKIKYLDMKIESRGDYVLSAACPICRETIFDN